MHAQAHIWKHSFEQTEGRTDRQTDMLLAQPDMMPMLLDVCVNAEEVDMAASKV